MRYWDQWFLQEMQLQEIQGFKSYDDDPEETGMTVFEQMQIFLHDVQKCRLLYMKKIRHFLKICPIISFGTSNTRCGLTFIAAYSGQRDDAHSIKEHTGWCEISSTIKMIRSFKLRNYLFLEFST